MDLGSWILYLYARARREAHFLPLNKDGRQHKHKAQANKEHKQKQQKQATVQSIFVENRASPFNHALAIGSIACQFHLIKDFGSLRDDTRAPPSSSLIGSAENTKVDLMRTLAKNGGFCPVTTACPIGRTKIRDAWTTNDAEGSGHVEANKNEWALVKVPGVPSYQMLTRDKTRDRFISKSIQDGAVFNPHIRGVLVRELLNKTSPVFVDIGANIGYFTTTALALGAKVVSFEPFLDNAVTIMSTVRKNGWRDRIQLYMNAVSFESVRVMMKSTNEKTNLSNMHIVDKQCIDDSKKLENNTGRYGVDYMDAVSLDQVMLTELDYLTHVDLMKIDVETYEIQVLNGAMHFLCNRVVKKIVMEVEYLKPNYNSTTCNFEAMQNRLEQMGFTTWDCSETKNLTGKSLSTFPSDVLFRQENLDKPPAVRLKGTENNPCEAFELKTQLTQNSLRT